MKKTLILSTVLFLLAGISSSAFGWPYFESVGNDDLEMLLRSASTGDVVTLHRLLNDNPDLVNARSLKDGKTALHVACMNGKYNAAVALLNRGASPNLKDYYCKTPYYYPKVTYNHRIAKLLKNRGAERERVRFFPHCCTEMHPNPALRKPRAACKP